jgi:hypothetical protein
MTDQHQEPRKDNIVPSIVYCPECLTPRPMAIKSIKIALLGRGDKITYRCTKCGAEKVKVIALK